MRNLSTKQFDKLIKQSKGVGKVAIEAWNTLGEYYVYLMEIGQIPSKEKVDDKKFEDEKKSLNPEELEVKEKEVKEKIGEVKQEKELKKHVGKDNKNIKEIWCAGNGSGYTERKIPIANYFIYASRMGSISGSYNCGVGLEKGKWGFGVNIQAAKLEYESAASKGHVFAQAALGRLLLKEEKYDDAIRWLKLATRGKDPSAQHLLGECYEKGYSVPRDEKEAVRLYKLGMKQGNANAMIALGKCYMEGVGVTQNRKEAMKYFVLAENKGGAEAEFNLALYYQNKQSDNPEEKKFYREEAFRLFTLSAKHKYMPALISLGKYYQEKREYKTAERCFEEIVKGGDLDALHKLGQYYLMNENIEKGLELLKTSANQNHTLALQDLVNYYLETLSTNLQDKEFQDKEILSWLFKAHKQGYAQASIALGKMYATGNTFLHKSLLSKHEAYKIYLRYVEHGDPIIQTALAKEYLKEGIGGNVNEANGLLRLASAQNYAPAQFELGYLLLSEEKNQQEGVRYLRLAAEQGIKEAQYQLGLQCKKNKDFKEAVKWLELAAKGDVPMSLFHLIITYNMTDKLGIETGNNEERIKFLTLESKDNSVAQALLGKYYLEGKLVPKDEKLAVEYLENAATKNNPMAQYFLAQCYQQGIVKKQSNQDALKYYEKAAKKGHPDAQYEMGRRYEEGLSVRADKKIAFDWFNEAARQNHMEAEYKVGMIYKAENKRGPARELLRRAADKGHVEAKFNLADIYVQERKGDSAKPLLIELAKELNHSAAMVELGVLYAGGFGIQKDEKETVRWFKKAAEQKNPIGQFYLGKCYEDGFGIDPDKEEAFKWYEISAKQGNLNAQHRLGLAYLLGERGLKNPREAERLFRLARDQGYSEEKSQSNETIEVWFKQLPVAAFNPYQEKLEKKSDFIIYKEGEENRSTYYVKPGTEIEKKNNEAFVMQFNELIDLYKKWGEENKWHDHATLNGINKIKEHFFNSDFSGMQPNAYFETTKSTLENLLKKFKNDDIDLEKRKRVYQYLVAHLAMCGPGIYTHVQDAQYQLTSEESVDYWLAEQRKNIIKTAADIYITQNKITHEGTWLHIFTAFSIYASNEGWNPLISIGKGMNDPHAHMSEEALTNFFHPYFVKNYNFESMRACIQSNLERLFVKNCNEFGYQLNSWNAVNDDYNQFVKRISSILEGLGVSFNELTLETNDEATDFRIDVSSIVDQLCETRVPSHLYFDRDRKHYYELFPYPWKDKEDKDFDFTIWENIPSKYLPGALLKSIAELPMKQLSIVLEKIPQKELLEITEISQVFEQFLDKVSIEKREYVKKLIEGRVGPQSLARFESKEVKEPSVDKVKTYEVVKPRVKTRVPLNDPRFFQKSMEKMSELEVAWKNYQRAWEIAKKECKFDERTYVCASKLSQDQEVEYKDLITIVSKMQGYAQLSYAQLTFHQNQEQANAAKTLIDCLADLKETLSQEQQEVIAQRRFNER